MNTITAELKTHLYIVADGMEGQGNCCGTKEQELINQYKKGISFPKNS
jgi:hypothetical protein